MASAGGEQIGSAHIFVGVNDESVEGDLHETEASARATFERMDKMRARPEIDADIRGVEEKELAVKRKMATIEKLRADPNVGIDDKIFQTRLKVLRAQLKKLAADKYAFQIETRKLTDATREFKESNRALNDWQAASQRAEASAKSQGLEVARLRDKYASLLKQQKSIAGQKRFLPLDREDEIRLARINTELEHTSARLVQLGSTTEDVNVDVDRNHQILRRWATSLSNIRIHVGVASLTLRQLGLVLATLGPIFEGLIGATGALIGSLGAGLAGALAIGAAGATGFGLAAVGIFQALKPATTELGAATDAFKAYDDAVRKYGKGSDQAKTAQQNLNTTLRQVSPEAARAARAAQQLRSSWERATAPVRQDFFRAIETGLQTAQQMMPMFARNMNQTMDTAVDGWEHWMETLRSPAVADALNNVMQNFNKALPNAMRGVENLAVAFLNLASAASNNLGKINSDFAEWSGNLRATTENASQFQNTVDHGFSSMRTWMSFLGAAGDLLVTFFSAGRRAGDGLLKTVTATFKQWTAWMETADGQRSLQTFFQQAADMAMQFFATLAPILEILYQITRVTAPITQAVLQIVEAVADLVAGFMELDAVRPILQGIATLLAGAFVVGRIAAFAGAIRSVAVAFGLLKGATATTAVAAGIARSMGGAAVATGGAAAATRGFGGALAGIAARVNPVTAAVAAFGAIAVDAFQDAQEQAELYREVNKRIGVDLATSEITGRQRQSYVDLAEGVGKAEQALGRVPAAAEAARGAVSTLRQAQQNYNQTLKEEPKHSQAVYQALYQLQKARDEAVAKAERLQERMNETTDEQTENVKDSRAAFREATRSVKEYRDGVDSAGEVLSGTDYYPSETAAKRLEEQAEAEKVLRTQLNLRAGAQVSMQRSLAGLNPIAEAATNAVGRFSRTFRGVPNARKLMIQTNSSQAVGELAKVANQTKRVSSQRAVVRILADSSSAEEAIARLNRLEIRKKKQVIEQTGAEGVVNWLEKLGGFKLPGKVQKVSELGISNVISNLAKLGGVSIRDKSFRVNAVDAASSVISGVISRLGSVHDKTVTLTTIERRINTGRAQGGPVSGFAKGADERMMERAMGAASGRSAQMGRVGGEYRRPTYIVGEENKREWVIAENPAYRAANENYLAAAAREFGYSLVGGFKKGGAPLFGPRSEYEAFRHRISDNESLYGNMERQYREQLAAGVRYPIPNIADLITQKGLSIEYTDALTDLINDTIIKRLKKQAQRKLPKLGHKPPASREQKRKRWEKRKEDYDKIKDSKNEARDRIPEMQRELKDLANERYGYALDLASIERGDLTAGGAGGADTGETIGEQFAGFNQQRFDALKQFGGNFQAAFASITSPSSRFDFGGPVPAGFGGPAAGPSVAPPAFAGSSPGAGQGGGTTIEQNNYFAAPPDDPHTFTQGALWEAGAVA